MQRSTFSKMHYIWLFTLIRWP